MGSNDKARKRGRPPASIGAETKGRILKAARSCFAAYGYSSASNKQIADEAGLTAAAIYNHFESKSQLFAAAVERAIASGAANLCLTVFDANEGAIRLYKRLGGALTERGFDDIGGGKAADTRVEWHDLPALLEACRS